MHCFLNICRFWMFNICRPLPSRTVGLSVLHLLSLCIYPTWPLLLSISLEFIFSLSQPFSFCPSISLNLFLSLSISGIILLFVVPQLVSYALLGMVLLPVKYVGLLIKQHLRGLTGAQLIYSRSILYLLLHLLSSISQCNLYMDLSAVCVLLLLVFAGLY